MESIEYDTDALDHPIGTTFTPLGKAQRLHTITGYRIIHDTDTGETKVTYRVSYEIMGQTLTTDVPRVTVQRALWAVK